MAPLVADVEVILIAVRFAVGGHVQGDGEGVQVTEVLPVLCRRLSEILDTLYERHTVEVGQEPYLLERNVTESVVPV